ncbi:MAG: Rid family detoxifying hydrolase [Candidatus Kariarchaeaceae archaeon]
MSRKVIWTDKCNTPGGHYSQGITYNGILYTSGIVPVKPKTHEVVGKTIEEATKQTMNNLSEVAKAAGTSLENALKFTVYLTNMSDFKRFNDVYATYFTNEPPARTTVTIAGLLRTIIEIEAIIAIPEN